jgi:sigma-E factor negative regulatory protein RseA
MDSKMEQREMISALADGQLRGDAFARAVEAAVVDAQAREAWHTYHLIGDVLRTGRAGVGRSPEAFLDKLSQQLALEEPLRAVQQAPVPSGSLTTRPAANDGTFRWKMMAGLASVAAVAAVGWSMVTGPGAGLQQPPQLASAPVPLSGEAGNATVVAGERGAMIRDARLDEILAAHRQFGGASALQMPAGFLRNATFEGPSR